MVKNLLWDLSGKLGAQVVSLVISLVLTRLLSPEEFGVMGIAMVFIFVSWAFMDMGFSRALVQKLEITSQQYSSVFFLNLLIGIVLCTLFFLLAGPISVFYKHAGLESLLRVLSIVFVLNAMAIVPGAVLSRGMKFKFISVASLLSALISGMVSVVMAYQGFGIWSLVVQQLLSSTLTLIFLFYFSRWKPVLSLDLQAIRPLWNYGGRLFMASMLGSLVSRLDIFMIGKLYSTATLGYYSRAQSFENFFRNMSTNSLTAVFFPVVSRLQEKRAELTPMYIRYLHITAFVSAGLVGILFLVTSDLFVVLFTAKWSQAAEYFQLMIMAGFGWPLSALILTLIAALGNARTYLNLEIFRTVVLVPVMVFGIYAGIYAFLAAMVVVRFAFLAVNLYFVSKELKLPVLRQLRIVGTYLGGAVMAVSVSMVMDYVLKPGGHLARVIFLGTSFSLVYLLFQYMLKTEALREMQSVIPKIREYQRGKRA
jgi:O-antigen/teichoic acid export membrane protein